MQIDDYHQPSALPPEGPSITTGAVNAIRAPITPAQRAEQQARLDAGNGPFAALIKNCPHDNTLGGPEKSASGLLRYFCYCERCFAVSVDGGPWKSRDQAAKELAEEEASGKHAAQRREIATACLPVFLAESLKTRTIQDAIAEAIAYSLATAETMLST